MLIKKVVLLVSLLLLAFVSFAEGLININTADANLLSQLDGIGESKAAAIVEYRNNNGPFDSITGLVKVKGVGKTILESNREKITVN